MPWIKSHTELDDHPKTKKAARLLGVSVPTIIGHLHCLWHWALSYAEDGCLTGRDPQDIADGAKWEGPPGDFIDALVNCSVKPGGHGFIERLGASQELLFIHDWEEYTGALVVIREHNRLRAKAAYESSLRSVRKVCTQTTRRKSADYAQSAEPDKIRQDKSRKTREENTSSADAPRKRTVNNDMWDALAEHCGPAPITKSGRGVWNRAIKELLNADDPLLPEHIPRLVMDYRKRWPNIECTPAALAKNLAMLRAPPVQTPINTPANNEKAMTIAIEQAMRRKEPLYCEECGSRYQSGLLFDHRPECSEVARLIPFEFLRPEVRSL